MIHTLHHILHYAKHHWSEIIVFGGIVAAILGVLHEMIFDHGPLDHEDDSFPN